MRFTKMHGIGNDYLFVNCFEEVIENPERLAIVMSKPHFGAGADGLVLIEPADGADFGMRIFNADGSEARMCGNGIRCVGKYVYDKGYTDKTSLTIETLSGIRKLELSVKDGVVESATVDMGVVLVEEDLTLNVADREVCCTPVSVGNPHAVIFVDDAEAAPVASLGPIIETHSTFPGGINVEFVQVLGERELRMRVWERGSGITMACGTGACASVAAAVHKGFCPAGTPLTVHLDGGDLQICVSEDHVVTMNGPAVSVYEGEVSL